MTNRHCFENESIIAVGLGLLFSRPTLYVPAVRIGHSSAFPLFCPGPEHPLIPMFGGLWSTGGYGRGLMAGSRGRCLYTGGAGGV